MGKKKSGTVGFGESLSFGLFAFGAILSYYLIYSYLQLYLTDIGISAAVIGIIFIIAKVWDAVNDQIFGVIIDRHHGKKGKYIPWLRIAGFAIPLTTIFMFSIPAGIGISAKIAWAIVAYVLWDLAYTMYDAPLNSTITVATSDLNERNRLFSTCSFFVYLGGLFVAIAVPVLYPSIGWGKTGMILGIISLAVSVILPFVAKERVAEPKKEEEPSVKELLGYVLKNKYLLTLVISSILGSLLDFATTVQAYFAIHCLGSTEYLTPLALATAVPVLFVAFLIPVVCKKHDKFKTYVFTRIVTILFNVAIYFIGYGNFTLLIILIVVRQFFASFWALINPMMIADCVEYGTYITGERTSGISFSLKAFTNKLVVALAGALGMFALSMVGFIEGQGVVQSAETVKGIWFLYSLMPAISGVVGVSILCIGYKLRDRHVKAIAAFNRGEISREEAEDAIGGEL